MTAHAPAPDHVLRTRYRVGGMDCGSCAARIETALRRLDGVEDVSVSAAAGTMLVRHTPAMQEDALAQLLGKLGFQMLGRADGATSDAHAHAHDGCEHHQHAHGHAHEHAHAAPPARPRAHDHGHAHDHGALESGPWYASAKARLALACGAASLAALAATSFLPDLGQWPYVAAGAIGLAPIAARALAAARAGAPWTIELLMTIAAIGAVAIGAAEEAAAVVFLFLVGEVLEGLAARRARASIQSLADLAPKTALLRRDGQTREVAASALQIGDEILVRPGDRIPADGEILEGAGGIDESPVTGESAPVPKGVGAPVFAGAIALDAALVVRVTAAASDNTIARIVRLVEEAQEAKAPTERLIDRFARVYTPAVLATGALVAIAPPLLAAADWREWIYKGLAVLLIGCPCALVISTPAAIAAGLSAGARRGLLLKGGAVLEQAGRITVAAFDKTGTLTQGRPVVTDVLPLSSDARDVLALAAGLETGASHPLAKAVLARAAADGVAPIAASDIAARPGAGVTGRAGAREIYFGSLAGAQALAPLNDATRERARALAAEGKSVSILLVDGQAAGLLAMRDEPRPDARAGLELLRRRGVRTLMVTGDNRQTAQAVARALDIEPHAELLPADKQKIVRDLQARGEIVAKIGDGINDAPGLAAADIGVAMGGAADVALETADAAILNGRVADVWAMIRLSHSTMSNIRQNIAVALGLKAVFLVTTIAGVTGLWPAILADTGATVLVTMNALRLLSIRLHEEDAAPAD